MVVTPRPLSFVQAVIGRHSKIKPKYRFAVSASNLPRVQGKELKARNIQAKSNITTSSTSNVMHSSESMFCVNTLLRFLLWQYLTCF